MVDYHKNRNKIKRKSHTRGSKSFHQVKFYKTGNFKRKRGENDAFHKWKKGMVFFDVIGACCIHDVSVAGGTEGEKGICRGKDRGED